MAKDQGLDIIELKSLKGHFLAASPAMNDPRFIESLILIAHHDETGALGFIINQPLANLSFHELLDQIELDPPKSAMEQPVLNGGPVRSSNGFVLYQGSLSLRDEFSITDQIFFSRSLDILKLIIKGQGPQNYLICLGRAEWSPGQLEAELKENIWLPSPASAGQIFSGDTPNLWSEVLRAQGISTANFTTTAGHA